MKNKIINLKFLFLITTSLFLTAPEALANDLVPCGPTKGMCTICHLIEMGQRIFEFLLKVSLAFALLFVAIAGILYITSSGSQEMMNKAKSALKTTLIGFAFCLIAWILMTALAKTLGYTGGENWWNVKMKCKSNEGCGGDGAGAGGDGAGAGGDGAGQGNGGQAGQQNSEQNPANCPPVNAGPCSQENLATTCFGSEANEASGICGRESGGRENALSSTDRCQGDSTAFLIKGALANNNPAFSVGLFQINLTVHDIPDVENGTTLNCPDAFNHKANYDSSIGGYRCEVVNQELYEKCVAAAQNPKNNIAKACELYGNRKWADWGSCGGSWGSNSVCCFE